MDVKEGKAKSLIDIMTAYGIGVRAGVLTPNIEDEKAIRKMMGLPEVSKDVENDWKETGGVRKPTTIKVTEDIPEEIDNAKTK